MKAEELQSEFEIKRGLSLEEVKELVDQLLATKQVAECSINTLKHLIQMNESDETMHEQVDYWKQDLQSAWGRRNAVKRVLNFIEIRVTEGEE